MKNLNQEENDFSFPQKVHRIRYFKDFSRLLEYGNIKKLPFGIVRFTRNEKGVLRIAVSVSKKFSKKSTERNKLKRVISEIFRKNKYRLKWMDIWIQVKVKVPFEEIMSGINMFIDELKYNDLLEDR